MWISPNPLGHIQATGRDARGRKQYRYHERWRTVRDEAKYDRLADFAKALPRIRAQVASDLAQSGVPRERVLATAVRILEETLMRVGNVEYARANRSRSTFMTGSWRGSSRVLNSYPARIFSSTSTTRALLTRSAPKT